MSDETDFYDSTAVESTGGSDLDASTPIETWRHRASETSTQVESTPAAMHGEIAHNRLHRTWDAYDAYLFDIDGTLLHCRDAVHYHAFCEALTRVAGRPLNLDGVAVQGKIDPGILRDAFERAGVPEPHWRPQKAQMLHAMGAHVEAHAADFDMEVLPGVREILAHLQRRGALLGVGTGNLERIGWAKLKACGLRDFFKLGGFSDNYEVRGEMIAGAVAEARTVLGNAEAAVLVVGDTPGDIAAARAAGVDVIAVATGIYTAQQLQDADLVVRSLRDLLG